MSSVLNFLGSSCYLLNFQNVAVNQKYIAVATDARLLRIFTVGGLQYQLLSIPGPIVSMAMSETQILIVYHQGTGEFKKLLYYFLILRSLILFL